MQIESLKVFCDLAETKSFTKAAQINNVTQSAVSQTISALERRFKSLLIERSKKNFRLTPEGEVFYDYSKRILQTCDALFSKLQEIEDVVSGNIRVATVYSIGLHVLPPYVTTFLKRYPSVNVHVEYKRDNQVYENVLGNVVDLGLVAYPTRDPKLEVVSLRTDKLVLIDLCLAGRECSQGLARLGESFRQHVETGRAAIDCDQRIGGVRSRNAGALEELGRERMR